MTKSVTKRWLPGGHHFVRLDNALDSCAVCHKPESDHTGYYAAKPWGTTQEVQAMPAENAEPLTYYSAPPC